MKDAMQSHSDPTSWSYRLEATEQGNSIPSYRRYAGFGFMAAFLLLAVGSISLYQFYQQPSAQGLVGDMIQAAGGMDSWNQIQEGQFLRVKNLYDDRGTLLNSHREKFFFQKTSAGVQLLVKSFSDQGDVTIISQDKNGSWATVNGDSADAKTKARSLGMMCASERCQPLCAASMAFYRFSMPFKLADQGVIPQYLGANTLNGQTVHSLDITFQPEVGRDRWVFMCNPKTHLIQKIEYHHVTDQGVSHPEEIYWSDHHTVAGITFSHRWTRFHSNGKVLEETLFSEVDFETPLGDAFFQRPGNQSNPYSSALSGM